MYRTNTNASFHARSSAAASSQATRPVRYRARDFGIGYGSSSGYASSRSYTPGSQPATRFRLG